MVTALPVSSDSHMHHYPTCETANRPEDALPGRLAVSMGSLLSRRRRESRMDIKFYLKLPSWFEIQTPLGTYNPDWALVKQEAESEPKLYFVRETKSSMRQFDLRNSEEMKIWCGKAHFDALQKDLYDKACDPSQI